MGEQKVEQKNEGAAPPAQGGEKKAAAEVVLKMDLHCEGCAKKVRRSVSHFEGVEKVKTDCGSGKLTVIGDVDPAWLRERVESKTKKKVDLISPQPKKDAGAVPAADKKPQDTVKKAPEDDQKKPKEKEAVVSTVALKLKLHCEGCGHKIKRMILKNVDGVNSVTLNLEKDLVMVTGTMAAKELSSYLQQKLKRTVDILPPPKKDDGGGDKKEKEGSGGEKKEKEKEKEVGGDKKEKDGGGAEKNKEGDGGKTEKKEGGGGGGGGGEVKKSEEGKVEVVNRMEFQGYNPQTFYTAMPMQQYQHMYKQSYTNQDYGMPMPIPMYHNNNYGYGHPGNNVGYAVHYTNGPPPPPPTYINDQMFSDENPNGCSVM